LMRSTYLRFTACLLSKIRYKTPALVSVGPRTCKAVIFWYFVPACTARTFKQFLNSAGLLNSASSGNGKAMLGQTIHTGFVMSGRDFS
jgi:hypothetical protein